MSHGSESSDPISSSWWWKHQSNTQWLHSTLSELDQSTQEMLALMQLEDGDTFAQRAEMYYQRRPELVKKVEEFRRSYHRLAEYCGHHHQHPSGRPIPLLRLETSPHDATTIQPITHLNVHGTISSPVAPPVEPSSSDTSPESELPKRSADEFSFVGDDEPEVETMEQRIACWERVSAAVEEAVGELARRNADKREARRELEVEVGRLSRENAVLQRRVGRAEEEDRAALLLRSWHVKDDDRNNKSSSNGNGVAAVDCPRCSAFRRRKPGRASRLQWLRALVFRKN